MSPLNTMRTDLGNAERFVERHGKDVRYVAPWKRWIYWTGTHWASDETLNLQRLAKETVRSMWSEVPDLPRDETGDWVKHIMRSEGDARLRALLDLARAEPAIAIMPDDLDRDPWLLAVQNGVLDLRTGRLGPHSRELMITKLVPASFDPEARCDRWEAFLGRVLNGSAEMINFLQRAVGYSLTGSTSARVLFFLYGMGANGKSTFLEILRTLLAGYAQQADFTSFLDTNRGDGPRNDIARLFGARVVTSSEVGEGKRLNESLVKTLTGKDTVTARFLHAEYFEYKPQFKLWLAANHRPIIRGTDSAIWDRVRLIPFTVSISPEERDPELVDKLLAELPGILAWSVAGCLHWHRRGLGAPTAVTEATDTYRKDSDTLGAFLEECCDVAIGHGDVATPATELYLAYRKWAEIGGEYVLPQTTFGRRLEERGITSEKRGRDRARVKWRLGVRLIDPLLAGDPREAYRGNGVTASRNNGDRDRHTSSEADALF
jgi:putative DNA primase/helicase